MRALLLEFRDKIQGFRGVVESSLIALKNGLSQRTGANAAREVSELRLDTFHVVSKVEKLNIAKVSLNVDLYLLPYSSFIN